MNLWRRYVTVTHVIFFQKIIWWWWLWYLLQVFRVFYTYSFKWIGTHHEWKFKIQAMPAIIFSPLVPSQTCYCCRDLFMPSLDTVYSLMLHVEERRNVDGRYGYHLKLLHSFHCSTVESKTFWRHKFLYYIMYIMYMVLDERGRKWNRCFATIYSLHGIKSSERAERWWVFVRQA